MKKAAPCLYSDADGPCLQSRNGARHYGHDADHDYLGEKKAGFGSVRAPLAPRSSRPNRVQRAQEGSDEAREHHARVQHCEAPAYGIMTPCGQPGTPDAIREHSHSIGKGMGGGKDYAASDGACAILCRKHHRSIDTDRAKAREVGLSIRAPVPDKIVPRRSDWNQPLFDDEED